MKIEKVEQLVTNLHDKQKYLIDIRNLKQALNHGLVLKKVHRVVKFNQKAWIYFKKDFFNLMNNAASGKTMENLRKYTDTKLVTIEGKKNYLVSETNYQTTKKFSENLLANKMGK